MHLILQKDPNSETFQHRLDIISEHEQIIESNGSTPKITHTYIYIYNIIYNIYIILYIYNIIYNIYIILYNIIYNIYI